MKNKFIAFILFLAGTMVGGSFVWVKSYFSAHDSYAYEIVNKVISHSQTEIREDNFHCETTEEKTVGSVLGVVFGSNIRSNKNMISFSCSETICSLSVTNCKPWQNSECGSTILKFEMAENNEISPQTFECIDVP